MQNKTSTAPNATNPIWKAPRSSGNLGMNGGSLPIVFAWAGVDPYAHNAFTVTEPYPIGSIHPTPATLVAAFANLGYFGHGIAVCMMALNAGGPAFLRQISFAHETFCIPVYGCAHDTGRTGQTVSFLMARQRNPEISTLPVTFSPQIRGGAVRCSAHLHPDFHHDRDRRLCYFAELQIEPFHSFTGLPRSASINSWHSTQADGFNLACTLDQYSTKTTAQHSANK